MKRMLHLALALGAVSCIALSSQGVSTATPTCLQSPSGKVMSEFHGVKLGMKAETVRAAFEKAESTSETSDEFKLSGDDSMTVHYDNGVVKAIQLAFLDPKNAPVWKDVIGDADINEMPNGAKSARKVMEADKYWVSMYQNKEGTITRITISR
jgi:hypothetical protein